MTTKKALIFTAALITVLGTSQAFAADDVMEETMGGPNSQMQAGNEIHQGKNGDPSSQMRNGARFSEKKPGMMPPANMGQSGSGTMGMMNEHSMHEGNMGGEGMKGMENALTNSGVVSAIQAKGYTVPTQAEMEAHMATMEAARTAEKNISEADKTGLETLRQSFRKQEREYLRTKGVAFPSEDEIVKFQAIHEVIRSLNPSAQSNKMGTNTQNGRNSENMQSNGRPAPMNMEGKNATKTTVKKTVKKTVIKKTIKKPANTSNQGK